MHFTSPMEHIGRDIDSLLLILHKTTSLQKTRISKGHTPNSQNTSTLTTLHAFVSMPSYFFDSSFFTHGANAFLLLFSVSSSSGKCLMSTSFIVEYCTQ